MPLSAFFALGYLLTLEYILPGFPGILSLSYAHRRLLPAFKRLPPFRG